MCLTCINTPLVHEYEVKQNLFVNLNKFMIRASCSINSMGCIVMKYYYIMIM